MRVFSIICIIIALFSCNEKQRGNAGSSPTIKGEKANDTTKYFEVSQFIKAQINEVNRTPYFIYKLTASKKARDSTAIDNTQFNLLARQFLEPDINDPSLKKYYTENIFFDETTKTYNFSYTTLNKELELQSVDVLLDEDGKTVKRIFLRKFRDFSDSSAIEQLNWKPNDRFQLIRRVQTASDTTEAFTETVVVWK